MPGAQKESMHANIGAKTKQKGKRKMNKVVITRQEHRDNEHAITSGNDKEGNVG